MTLSQILVSILIALLSGFVAAYLTPFFNANFARRNWRQQKAFDLKYEVFQGAVTALAAWLTDALDVNLQNSKGKYKGASRLVEMRPETSQALEKSRGMVEAFFSHEVAQKFDEATRAELSIDTVPNAEFERKRLAFIVAASQELGLEAKTRRPLL